MIKKSQKLLTRELNIQYYVYKHEIFLKTYDHFKLRNVNTSVNAQNTRVLQAQKPCYIYVLCPCHQTRWHYYANVEECTVSTDQVRLNVTMRKRWLCFGVD